MDRVQGAERLELSSRSYRVVKIISIVMDRWMLDPIVGLLLPGGGDLLTTSLNLPYLYISIFKVKSLPLTLAVVYNILFDLFVGLVPLLGDILDFFVRSYNRNLRLVVGFVEGNSDIIAEVKRKATMTAAFIVILLGLIYLLFSLLDTILSWMGDLFSSLF